MKKVFSILSIVVLIFLVLLTALFFVFRNDAAKLLENARSLVDSGSGALLLIEEGEVFYKETGGGEYALASDEQELDEGTWVKTGTDSKAILVLLDNSVISLDKETEIELAAIPSGDDNNTLIKQYLGNVWHRIGQLTGTDSYEVQTPNAIAAVRGTIFGSLVNGDLPDEIFSVEDDVSVGQVDNGKVTNQATLVSGKYAAVGNIQESDGFTVSETPLEITNWQWFTDNRLLDDLLKDADFKNLNTRRAIVNEIRMREGNLFDDLVDNIPDPEEIDDDVLPVSGLYGESEQTCNELEENNIGDIREAYNSASIIFEFNFSLMEIENLFRDLELACEDSFLTNAEAQEMADKYSFIEL